METLMCLRKKMTGSGFRIVILRYEDMIKGSIRLTPEGLAQN